MPVYDVTLMGFRGDTDLTDDLVKWIKAPSAGVVGDFLELIGYIDKLHEPPRDMERDDLTPEDGVDIILNDHGQAIYGGGCWAEWDSDIRVARDKLRMHYKGGKRGKANRPGNPEAGGAGDDRY